MPASEKAIIDLYCLRSLEDFVTWKETSKIRQHILEYNDERDDYEFA